VSVIAHLSDPHLDTSDHRLRRLTDVLQALCAVPGVRAVVVTGDIADNGRDEEYEQFFTALDATGLPRVVVPGNHDVRSVMSAHVRPLRAGGPIVLSLSVGGVTVLGLDSLVEGHNHGRLGGEVLDFVEQELAMATGPVVLAMHHPPVPVGHEVMDDLGLRDAEGLEAVVRAHPQVAAVLTGHVHTALATTFAGRPVLGAPGIVSTMRLGSRMDPIADTAAVPGLALHTVQPTGHVSTVFHYLTPSAV
jgi:3',5'-cyclic AMP phosphodiesterase CpdA